MSGQSDTKKIKPRLKKRALLLIIMGELVLLLLFALILSQLISLNPEKPVIYADSQFTDEISCSDGWLKVNNVSVNVPGGDNASYSISYGWGKDDTDYPTVPKAATASFMTKNGKVLYDISLYRESFTPEQDIPSGKNAANWFDDWEHSGSGDSTQEIKIVGKINGFMISTVGSRRDGSMSTVYEDSSFYFAVKTKKGISVYVVEGILYDKGREDAFSKIMEKALSSITISKTEKKQAVLTSYDV